MPSPSENPERVARMHVLSAVVCCGPCSRRTVESKCDRHYGLPSRDVGERLAELAECGIVEAAGRQALTGDVLWVAVERTKSQGDVR